MYLERTCLPGSGPSRRSEFFLVSLITVCLVVNVARGDWIRVEPYTTDRSTALLLHLDGNATDAAKAGRVLRSQGARWISDGVMGKALSFREGASLSAPVPPQLADGFTIEAWVRLARPSELTQLRQFRKNAPSKKVFWLNNGRICRKFVAFGRGHERIVPKAFVVKTYPLDYVFLAATIGACLFARSTLRRTENGTPIGRSWSRIGLSAALARG